MESRNAFATIVAYYLPRFNIEGYRQLDFGSVAATHQAIGRVLGVKPNYVKNRRDEFDPLQTIREWDGIKDLQHLPVRGS